MTHLDPRKDVACHPCPSTDASWLRSAQTQKTFCSKADLAWSFPLVLEKQPSCVTPAYPGCIWKEFWWLVCCRLSLLRGSLQVILLALKTRSPAGLLDYLVLIHLLSPSSLRWLRAAGNFGKHFYRRVSFRFFPSFYYREGRGKKASECHLFEVKSCIAVIAATCKHYTEFVS